MLNQRRPIDGRCSVLYFTNSMLWGGVEEHICGLLRNLSRSLFRAHLVCDPVVYERFRSAVPGDVDITPLALSSPRHVVAAMRFAQLLLRGRFHIVHAHGFWSSLFASPIAWVCRVPVIIETLHGTEAWRKGWKANCTVDRIIARFVSKHIAVCESDALFLSTKKRVPPGKIAIIRNGVEASRFVVSQDVRRSLREALGWTETDIVLITVARFHIGKGHRVLLDAMRQLKSVYPNLKLILVGEGELEQDLRAECKRSGLTDCVRFVGYQANVPAWLRVADINVLPTFYEGFPLSVLEAMAAGLPTVASRVGGVPEAIDDGTSGLLVPPGEPTRLAEALLDLLRTPARRAQMGATARVRVAEKFLVEQQVRSTEKMYLKLCGANSEQQCIQATLSKDMERSSSSAIPISETLPPSETFQRQSPAGV